MINDIEDNVRRSFEIIQMYHDLIRTTNRPEEKLRSYNVIDEQWDLIEGYLKEYTLIYENIPVDIPNDILEISAKFPTIWKKLKGGEFYFDKGDNKFLFPKVYTYDENFSMSYPFDLGMICGLNRGSYVVVLAGWKDDGLYQYLIRTEEIVEEISEKILPGTGLSSREWIKIKFLEEIPVSSANNKGILLNINVDNLIEVKIFLEHLCYWFKSHINNVSASHQLNLIIHVYGNSIIDARVLASQIYQRSSYLFNPVPKFLLTLDYATRTESHILPSVYNADITYQFGNHFCSWIQEVLKQARKESLLSGQRRNILEKYSQLFKIGKEIITENMAIVPPKKRN
jgi:hypothetical protein